jgi:gamma-glutamyltranspeptidase/glutathione hydrolase
MVTHGIVAAPHHLAAEAGAAVLWDGGNAVDAAVAAGAVLCVVCPHLSTIGGDVVALVWAAGADRPVGLAGTGRSGSLATIEAVRAAGHEAMPERGALPVTVPGTAEAWGRLVERFGSLGLAPLMAAAADAAGGYVVTEPLAASLMEHADRLLADPASAALFPPLKAGMVLRNPELAATLRDIGRNGFLGFYHGEVARAIVAALERRGGHLTAGDLAMHRSAWVEPVAVPYRGLTVYELPPPARGLCAVAALRRLERLAPAGLGPGVDLARALVRIRDETDGLADRFLGDPDFVDVPREPFWDPDRPAPGPAAAVPEGGAAFLSAADEHGNVVSLAHSVAGPLGSGVVAEGTGVLLNDRGMHFSLDPRHVNHLEPRRRTVHPLIPALAARDGHCWSAFGTMGSDGQAQLLAGLADLGLDPAAAVAASRLRVAPGGALGVEADYPDAGQVARSVPSGRLLPPRSAATGQAAALVVDGPGRWRAAADPRSNGSVMEV